MSTNKATIPRATYRVQLHAGFGFDAASALCDYLADLGVSHVYTSPVLAAAPGSTHGYDVVDHTRVNPELGGETGLQGLESAMRDAALRWVLDIVPNHMAIHTPANLAFWDVLKHGQESESAAMFDIDWDPPQDELKGRVLLPILGEQLETTIEQGKLRVVLDQPGPALTYYEHRMPLTPGSLQEPIASSAERCNQDPSAMRELVDRQHYRPAFWRRASTQINYRRFFSINSLIGLRVEDRDVFDKVHALPVSWVKQGRLDGLRVDHPDGLRAPAHYLERLRQAAPQSWLVVEKILETDEQLPVGWPVDGTTGYDALNLLSGLFVQADSEATITNTYHAFTGLRDAFEAVMHEGKRDVLAQDFGGEIDRLVRCLEVAGLEAGLAKTALIELIVHWPVYRVYPDPEDRRLSEMDRGRVRSAINAAAEHSGIAAAIWEQFNGLLTLEESGEDVVDFAIRFQQLASAVTAKGVEDTAFYRYNRLIALNEVGGDPGSFGTTVDRFHAAAARLNEDWPATMIATTTHDTKRSEDARIRIAMLSQMPDRWAQAVQHWSEVAKAYRAADHTPSRDDEHVLYQTLVGAWPIEADRLKAYMVKAAREAKRQTNWTEQNAAYEGALTRLVDGLIADDRFVGSLEALLRDLLPAARVASLAQTLIKLTMPGVPDLYQGGELWDESLVDPDNRRPVDFDKRRAMLKKLDKLSPNDILSRMEDGLPKLWVTRQALSARREHPACFEPGAAYERLEVNGDRSDGVVAYRRGRSAVVVAPRQTLGMDAWSDQAELRLPAGRWRDAMSGRVFEAEAERAMTVGELWRDFPVSLLIQEASRS